MSPGKRTSHSSPTRAGQGGPTSSPPSRCRPSASDEEPRWARHRRESQGRELSRSMNGGRNRLYLGTLAGEQAELVGSDDDGQSSRRRTSRRFLLTGGLAMLLLRSGGHWISSRPPPARRETHACSTLPPPRDLSTTTCSTHFQHHVRAQGKGMPSAFLALCLPRVPCAERDEVAHSLSDRGLTIIARRRHRLVLPCPDHHLQRSVPPPSMLETPEADSALSTVRSRHRLGGRQAALDRRGRGRPAQEGRGPH